MKKDFTYEMCVFNVYLSISYFSVEILSKVVNELSSAANFSVGVWGPELLACLRGSLSCRTAGFTRPTSPATREDAEQAYGSVIERVAAYKSPIQIEEEFCPLGAMGWASLLVLQATKQ